MEWTEIPKGLGEYLLGGVGEMQRSGGLRLGQTGG